jgi:hypothetical protein
MDSRYEKPLPLTWTSEYVYHATLLEILHILSVENDYGIELTEEDFENFQLNSSSSFATASQLQEILFHKAIEHTLIRAKASDQYRYNTFTRVTLINKYVQATRKCIPDVEVDQFTPKQRRLYVFYGQGQSRPAHHTHMAQLVIINYYIRHCRQNNLPVGDKSEFQEFMMEFFGAPPYRPSSAPPLTVFTLNTHLIAEARRRGAETPEHEEYCKQFRDHRIALALEGHNNRYLKNQRRSPVVTRLSSSYYVYSEPATPDEVPGKQKEAAEAPTPDSVPTQRKKARLSGRLPGTSVDQPKQQSRTSQRRHKRKKNRFDLLYERTVEDTMKGKPIAWTTLMVFGLAVNAFLAYKGSCPFLPFLMVHPSFSSPFSVLIVTLAAGSPLHSSYPSMPSCSRGVCSRLWAINFFFRRLLDLVSDLGSNVGFDSELSLASVIWLTTADCGSVLTSASRIETPGRSDLNSGIESTVGSFGSLTSGPGIGSMIAGSAATLWMIPAEVDTVAPPVAPPVVVPALPFPPVLPGVLGAED